MEGCDDESTWGKNMKEACNDENVRVNKMEGCDDECTCGKKMNEACNDENVRVNKWRDVMMSVRVGIR